MRWLFLPLVAAKPWNGNTVMSEPLGGSEAAVAYLAQAIQRRGHQVVVHTHGIPGKDVAGVEYRAATQDAYAASLGENWDAVVSSRWPDVLQWPWKTDKRAIWLHDLPQPNMDIGFKAHLVVMISEFQLGAYNLEFRDGSKSRAVIIGDGVEQSLVNNIAKQERNENILLWVSNPDRGLALAAHIFNKHIHPRWPELEFHIYGRHQVYGWDKSQEEPFMPRRNEMDNIFLHDSLARPSLFKAISRAWAIFYPTFWPETFCMATLEAQALGTPVIASPFAALNETVKGGVLSYDFLNAISQLRNPQRWKKLSLAGVQFAQECTWDKRAEQWEVEVLK